MKDQAMTEAKFIARLASIIRYEDTESETSMRPRDDDEDSESDSIRRFIGSCNYELERPPHKICRNESKKRGG
jgi:hypothetical protein